MRMESLDSKASSTANKKRGRKRKIVEFEPVFAEKTAPDFYEDLNGYFKSIGLFS